MPDLTTDPLETAFDEFATVTEASLTRFAERIARQDAEIAAFRLEQRSAPVIQPPAPVVDVQEIATRAAALVPAPQVDYAEIVRQVIAQIPAPNDGKDANVEEIAARVAELTYPRIVALIPPPLKGEPGERGDDGLNAPDEIRAIAREEVLTNQRDFYRGVFTDGTQYRTADGVTWDGSMWFAQRDTKSKPGTDDSWKLAVKKGRDGKR